VPRHVAGNLPAQDPALYVSGAEVQARLHSGVDDLVQSIREPVEVTWSFIREAEAGHAEPDLVRAEEHFQHLQVRAVEGEVPRRVLGVRRRDKRRPGGGRARCPGCRPRPPVGSPPRVARSPSSTCRSSS
jgi:hypothetical protein